MLLLHAQSVHLRDRCCLLNERENSSLLLYSLQPEIIIALFYYLFNQHVEHFIKNIIELITYINKFSLYRVSYIFNQFFCNISCIMFFNV